MPTYIGISTTGDQYVQGAIGYDITDNGSSKTVTAGLYYRRTNSWVGVTYDSSVSASVSVGDATTSSTVAMTIPAGNYDWQGPFVSASKTFSGDATDVTLSWSASGGSSVRFDGSGSGTITVPSSYTSPSGLSVSLSSYTTNTATFAVSLSSYGTPSSASGRYIEAAILNQNSYGASYRYATASNTTSSTITVSNSSSGTSGFTITANTRYYYGAYATNTQRDINTVAGTFVTLPNAPTSVSASSITTTSAVISGSIDQGGGAYSATIQYSTNNGSSWSTLATTSSSSFSGTISGLTNGTSYTVLVRTHTSAGNSSTASVTFTTVAIKTLTVSGSNLTFNVTVGGSSVATGVSSYTGSFAVGTSYTVNNITASSGYRLASSAQSSYTGTVGSSGTTITIPASIKTYSFSWTCTRCTGDVATGGTTRANDSASYSATVDTGTAYAITDIKANSGYYFTSTNATTASSQTGTVTANTSRSASATACVAPYGGSIRLNSKTYNSVNLTGSISSFGSPASISGRVVRACIGPTSMTSYSGIWASTSASNTTTVTGTLNHSSTNQIAGCQSFKILVQADNNGPCSNLRTYQLLNSTTYYLPPAPLASASAEQVPHPNYVTVEFTMRGNAADGTYNITSASVYNLYRYSTDGGATFTNWAVADGATSGQAPANTVKGSFVIDFSTDIVLQLAQSNANSGTVTDISEIRTITLEGIQKIPNPPEISNPSYDELRRTVTITATAGREKFHYYNHIDMSYNSDYSDPFYSQDSYSNVKTTVTHNYLKPAATVYIRAKTYSTYETESDWAEDTFVVKRPIWGLAKTSDVTTNIVDMVVIKKDGTASERDFIEGKFQGKNRIATKGL